MFMKMSKRIFFATIIFSFLFSVNALASGKSMTIDKSNIANGVAKVTYSGSLNKKIMLKVDANSDSYQYEITSNSAINIPLQMGNGSYTFYLLERTTGNEYAVLQKESVQVKVTNQNAMFLVSNPIVNLSSGPSAISHYNDTLKSQTEGMQKLTSLYTDVVTNYTYDKQKASSVQSGYVPVIDEMYQKETGICYDYSALMAGVLRSQKLPTRLLMGYIPEIKEYHAWNQVLIDGKWVYIDTTYDSAYVQAGQKTKDMIKSGDGFKVLKIY